MLHTPQLMRLKRNNNAHENIQYTTEMEGGEPNFSFTVLIVYRQALICNHARNLS
jgi:hypothetical protein